MSEEPFVIVGAGAIGAIVGSHLVDSGHEVVFVEANRDHVAAMRAHGLKVTGEVDFTMRPKVYLPKEYRGTTGRMLLAVKSRHTIEALEPLARFVAPDGFVLSLQNGLEEDKIKSIVGPERTVGAFITFGGYYVKPGEVHYGGAGSFMVGELDGSPTPRVEALAEAFSHQQTVVVTDNIYGCLWGKMCLGAVYFGTAIVDAAVQEIYADAQCRAILGRIAGEAVSVADAHGVRTEAVDGFDPKVFRPGSPADPDAVAAAWQAQLHYWNSHDNTHTGVWRDLKIHKRKTEVDHQVGAIIAKAEEVGLDVPLLRRLKATVETIERGEQPQSFDRLKEMAG